jgi:hypothetical protein
MDKINGDLKPGDFILIEEWHGEKAFLKTSLAVTGYTSTFCKPEDEGAQPNRALKGDIVEIIAIDWPNAAVRVHQSCGHSGLSDLDLREFTCRKASPDYIAAVVVKPEVRGQVVPMPTPPPVKASWWRRLLRRIAEL